MLSTIDLAIVAIYAVGLFVLAQWVSREPSGQEKNAQDYFLAGKALPWWAIGASLIAANISAEQIIGMSGSGYAIGLAIASYEWMAAFTLLLVGKFLLPIFLKTGIYTMPQFLAQRYDNRVKTVMAVFWLGVYTFVNLTSLDNRDDRVMRGRGLQTSRHFVLRAHGHPEETQAAGLKLLCRTRSSRSRIPFCFMSAAGIS